MNHTPGPSSISLPGPAQHAPSDIHLPVTRERSSGARVSLPSNGRSSGTHGIRLNIEAILYLVIALLAVVTRFWDLSSRAQHHDESLHSYFSWLYYVGEGYTHDPLMHGPALFHANALLYLLFGDNDYTSRIYVALLGVAIVLLPALLRGPRLLGRWGALACSVFLLLSPSILFYTRFIRHDASTLLATLAIAIGCLRYLEQPARRWVLLVGAMSGYLFTTKEVSFIVAFVLVTFVVGVVAWQISKTLLAILAATGVGMLAVWIALPALGAPALPGIPWEDPTSSNIRNFAFDLAVHPVVLAVLGVALLGGIVAVGVLDRVRDREVHGWLPGILAPAPTYTTAHALYRLLLDRRALWLGIALALSIFTVLYTSMFTNMFGLGSATFGALGYWLGQQDVQRADQPWFYYLLLLPQYEFIAVLLFPVGILITLRRIVPALRAGQPVGRRNYLRGFAIYWALVNLAVFSWAGEKMPWLTVHIALPLIILAASLVGEAIERVELGLRTRQLSATPAWVIAIGIPALSAASFLFWSWASAGPWIERDGVLLRTLRPDVASHPWLLYVPLVALAALVIVAFARLGARRALPLLGITGVAVLLFAQVHAALRLTYYEGDVPRDMLVYVQTSPDVTRAVEDIGTLSRELTGGKALPVAYDAGTSWPFQWYLRNYTDRRYFGEELSAPPDEPIVLISNEHLYDGQNEEMLSGYTFTEYSMRWWFPEDETYRRFAIAPELIKTERQNYQTDEPGPYSATDVVESVWRSIWGMREPQQQAKMFRLVAFRELWAPIGSYNFRVYVRNDLIQTWNDIRY